MSCFVTFEGPEGCGKTTQARLLAARLEAAGRRVLLTREPGGTAISEQIRAILLHPHNNAMLPETEVLLYLAARAQHTRETIRPSLAAGAWVICDRYSDSTLAYQGYGRGLPLTQLEAIDAFATGGLRPDLTVFLDIPVVVGLARKQGQEWNRLEESSLSFHERVRQGYHALIEREPERFLVLDGERPVDILAAMVGQRVAALQPRG